MALFFTDVTQNLIVSLSTGLAVVLIHGIFRKTDDLYLEDMAQQQGGGWYSVISGARGGPSAVS